MLKFEMLRDLTADARSTRKPAVQNTRIPNTRTAVEAEGGSRRLDEQYWLSTDAVLSLGRFGPTRYTSSPAPQHLTVGIAPALPWTADRPLTVTQLRHIAGIDPSRAGRLARD